MLFAQQAASALANARAHRDERRARADLEALVETSPVGVLVLDARSGRPLSFNREAWRIAERLREPGRPPEQLLEAMTVRRADGSELSLDALTAAPWFTSGETVRAEEMSVFVPDGRSIRVLVNATPIRAGDDEAGSVVIVVQDLTPLDEIERQRAEFLGLVSHELREPLAAIRGSAVTLLEDAAALDPAEMREFHRIIAEQAGHMRGLIGDLLDAGRIDTDVLSVAPEPTELAELVERARSTFLDGGARHGVHVDLPAGLPRIMADRRRIVQVLNNLFANTARHAPEAAPIRVQALREDAHVAVAVADGAAVWRRSCCRGSSTSMAGPATGPATAWGWRSARGWWRRMAGASGPRAPSRASAPPSPSPCPWPGRPARRLNRHRTGSPPSRPAFWWSTATRRRCASCATRSPGPATPRW